VNKVLLVGVNKEDLEPNSQAYDLELTSDVEWKNGFFVFNVKNRSKKAWKGKVRFRAVNETNYNKIRRNQQNPGDAEQASLMEQIWFYSETEEEVSLAGNASTQVYLTLNEVFPDDKRDYYYFYLESVGKWTNGVQQDDEVKQIACFNSDLNVNSLPFNRQIDKSSLAKATDLQRLKDAEYAANLILAICSSINSVDKTLGDIKSTCKKINRGYVELESDIAFVSKYDKDFESLMQSTQAQRLVANFMVTTGVHIIDEFREKLVADILASSKTVSAYLGPAMEALQKIRTYEESYKKTDYEKMFSTADMILDFAKGKVGSPFIDIMATYLDVTKSIINYALQLGEQYYASTSSFMLYENIPSTEADKKKFKYNRNIDFKIMVSPRRSLNWFNFEKRGERGKNIIKSAVVKVNNKKNEPEAVATLLMEPVAVDDGIMLRQVGFDSGGPMGQGYLEMSIPFNRMWMEITWKNGRTSTIPLLDAGDAVKFELPDIFGHNTYRYTVYFDSEATSDHFENLADILTLKE